MNADASLHGSDSCAAADGPLRSEPAFASDGTLRLAPIGAVWNAAELREAYNQVMLAASQLGRPAASDWTDMMLILERLWAADFAFRPQDDLAEAAAS